MIIHSTILQEIFLRLPITSLIRCRHVCRLWRELIRDHYFTHIYTSQSLESKKGLMVHTINRPASNSKLYFINRRHDPIPTCIRLRLPIINLIAFTIIGSCNGILCLANRAHKFIRFACNPFLGECVLIPPRVYPIGGKLISMNCEFGFCLKTQSYKILEMAIWRVKNEENVWNVLFELHVYKLGDMNWKCVNSEPYQWLPEWNSASLVNGALHWVNSISARTICVFDLEDDVFIDMQGPKVVNATGNRFSTGVLRNCLSIMNTTSNHVDVWLMKQYGDMDSWEKSFVIDLPQMSFAMDLVRVLDNEEDNGLFISYDHEFGVYNFEQMGFDRVDIVGYRDLWFQVVPHCDTLISPFHLQEV